MLPPLKLPWLLPDECCLGSIAPNQQTSMAHVGCTTTIIGIPWPSAAAEKPCHSPPARTDRHLECNDPSFCNWEAGIPARLGAATAES